MSHYLIVQYPYDFIDIALCYQGKIVSSQSIHKHEAIGQTIPVIQQLLLTQNIDLSKLTCIGVNVGPGPYNTLRGLLTMMNGIHRITNIPLITNNALHLMNLEHQDNEHVIILNAFENHVFFSLWTNQIQLQAACHINDLIDLINQQPHATYAYGNGALKYQQELSSQCHSIHFTHQTPLFNKLETLAQQTYLMQNQADLPKNNYIKPIYFEDLKPLFKKNL